tara:strand:- start:140 stop:1657 length:1518 start_codon:yes stop_codon:yes gene_type:complete
MAELRIGQDLVTAAYIGTQGICLINHDGNSVLDAACGAQFTVTHTVTNNLGGTTNGYTISTSPGATFTGDPGDPYSFTTTVSLNSNYRWVNSVTPTISPAQPITGVVGSADSTVTTTLSNATVEVIPANVVRAQLNLNYNNIVGAAVNVGYTVTGDPDGDIQTGTNSLTYSFNSGTQLVSGYEWVGNPPSNATANGTTTTPGTTPVIAYFGAATIQLIQYSVTAYQQNSITGPTAGYDLSFNGTAKNTTGLTSVTETGTINDPNWSFTTTLSGPNATYQADTTLAMTGSDGSSSLSITTTGAWGDATNPETVTSTGAVSLANTNVTVTLVVTPNITLLNGATSSDYTITTASGNIRTGSAPSTYTFQTTVNPASGFTYSATGAAPSVLTTTAVFPTSSGNVPVTITGTITRPALFYIERSCSTGSCGDVQLCTYYWADPSPNLSSIGGTEADTIAPSGTQIYSDSNYGAWSGSAGQYSITQPGTYDDYTQYISAGGTVGSDSSCP